MQESNNGDGGGQDTLALRKGRNDRPVMITILLMTIVTIGIVVGVWYFKDNQATQEKQELTNKLNDATEKIKELSTQTKDSSAKIDYPQVESLVYINSAEKFQINFDTDWSGYIVEKITGAFPGYLARYNVYLPDDSIQKVTMLEIDITTSKEFEVWNEVTSGEKPIKLAESNGKVYSYNIIPTSGIPDALVARSSEIPEMMKTFKIVE